MTSTAGHALAPTALRAATDRFAALVAGAPDPDAALPGSAWGVRDVVAHLVTVAPRYAQGPRAEGEWVDDPRDLPDLNDRQLRELGRLDPVELLGRLRDSVHSLLDQVADYRDAVPDYRFHGGERIRADTALGILLGELLVHGWDVSRLTGAPWPLSDADVALVWRGVEPILPGWVDPDRGAGHTATYAVHLRGSGIHLLSFRDGRLTVGRSDRAVDVHIGGSPAEMLLALYRRRAAWRSALAGRLLAWGRRPWLALSLCDRFCRP